MAKEFDIFLNRRLTECDMIVWSLTYREQLSITEQLILETCLECYTLLKSMAVRNDTSLAAHIEQMRKICLERLTNHYILSSYADFRTRCLCSPPPNILEFANGKVKLVKKLCTAAESSLQIAALPAEAFISSPFGSALFGTELFDCVESTLKRSMEQASPQLLLDTSVEGVKKQSVLQIGTELVSGSALKDLLYRIYGAADFAVQTVAESLEMELHYPLGRAESVLQLDTQAVKEHLTKQETLRETIVVSSGAASSLTQFVSPDISCIQPKSEAAFIAGHHRRLYEMDGNSLSDYDNMTLEDIDYYLL